MVAHTTNPAALAPAESAPDADRQIVEREVLGLLVKLEELWIEQTNAISELRLRCDRLDLHANLPPLQCIPVDEFERSHG